MTKSDELAMYAEERRITILETTLEGDEDALSVQFGDRHIIALQHSNVFSHADRAVKYAHELGHCETGAFYNEFTPYQVREKMEYKADKWATNELIPQDELNLAVRAGATEIWEFAELFGVTDEFIRRAFYIYEHSA